MTEEHRFRASLERLLRVNPASKPAIYMQLFDASEIRSLTYWLELLFSAGIATMGLVLNSPAVVIGAMLISPLMGPILAVGLALAAADIYLGIKSVVTVLTSVAVSLALSALIVWLLPFHSPTAEVLARTQPNLLDLGVALLSGLAGSIVMARGGGGGGVTALPGVAVAVALMPPLCAAGFGLGSGLLAGVVPGAALLFLTNLAAIIASAFLTFFLVRMDSDEVRLQMHLMINERAASDPVYAVLHRTVLARHLGDLGKLRWRVLMLVVVLMVVFVPLRQGLLRVRDETVARTAARDAVRRLVPADALVSQQTDVTGDRIIVRLLVSASVGTDQVRQAERSIVQRTGREATIAVRRVASEEDLVALRSNLVTSVVVPAPPPPPPDLAAIRTDLLSRLKAPIEEAWPNEAAALKDYRLVVSPEQLAVEFIYESRTAIDAASEETLTKIFQARLGYPDLKLTFRRVAPPRGAPGAARRPAGGAAR